jgi:hypothetical protein
MNYPHGSWNLEVQFHIHKGPHIVSWIYLIPHIDTHFFKSILILSFHLYQGLPGGFFPVGLPVKILKALQPSSILASCPIHRNLLDLITITINRWTVQTIKFLITKTFSLPILMYLGPNIRLRILFSDTPCIPSLI